MRFRPGRWLAACAGLVLSLASGDPAAAAQPFGSPNTLKSKSTAARSPRKAKTPKKSDKPVPRLPGSKPGEPDEATRRVVTGQYPEHSTAQPTESPELKAMRELDNLLFPPVKAPPTAPWSLSIRLPEDGPRVDASGVPSAGSGATERPSAPEILPGADKKDLSWLTKLVKPDIPVRFEPSVVRYLEHYKDTPRGRSLLAAYVKKSGRYRDAIIKLLRQYKMPEDLVWLAMIESAFNPAIHSHAGAAGLWQFMPATGRIYGLTVNRRVDERLDPERSTHAALRHLKDLYIRFGTWELAFAAYNMGYGGLLASVRKFNTNDYWELRRLEAGMPYETALYVPKIVALAVAAKNCKIFGCDGVAVDPPEPFGDDGVDKVSLAPGVTLDQVAAAAEVSVDELTALNPQLIGSRLPPLEQSAVVRKSWTVYVPKGKGAAVSEALPTSATPRDLRTYRLRWGESLEHVAARFRTNTSVLERLNDLHPYESPRPDTTLFVPQGQPPKSDAEVIAELTTDEGKPVVVVPDHSFAYTDRRRVFYQAVYGDTIDEIASKTGVTASEIKRWNHLDASASLQDGMRLQLFLPTEAAPKGVLLLEEQQVRRITVESPSFFAHFIDQQGRKRLEVTVREGDTWKSLSKQYGLSLGMLERINHRSRHSKLTPGEKVIVYAKASLIPVADGATPGAADGADGMVAAKGEAEARPAVSPN